MIVIQSEDFDIAEQYAALRSDSDDAGAVVIFTGIVREFTRYRSHAGTAKTAQLTAMELEHYPGMTEKSLADIVNQARARWDIDQVRAIHRVGKLNAQDQIVFVGVSSAHRGEAFAACEFIMDYLKTRAPFWKKEYTQDGEQWVEAKAKDTSAAQRWRNSD